MTVDVSTTIVARCGIGVKTDKIEVQQGFQLNPVLLPSDQDRYNRFIQELLQQCANFICPTVGEAPIQINWRPEAAYSAHGYLGCGEHAFFTLYPCEAFVGLSSKHAREPMVRRYLRQAYFLARKHFPERAEYFLDFKRCSRGQAQAASSL